jgi:phosphoribosylformylglycinamidine synthase
VKAAVVTFPGSNCDDDVFYVLGKACGFSVDHLWHKDQPALGEYDLIVLPGGFSYGDYLRCGAIASLSPILDRVKGFAEAGGFVMGICNGFQILCESRLLPGALARNEKSTFICRDVTLMTGSNTAPWTCELKDGEAIRVPIAHGEGRYVCSEDEYGLLKRNGQVLFTYAENPNGSVHAIAGVCNETKNVFGLMPHPERATDLRSREGMKIWSSIVKTIKTKHAHS